MDAGRGGPEVRWAPPDGASGPGLEVGALLGRTFAVFGREWSLFMALSVPVAIAYALQALVPSEDIGLLAASTLVTLLIGTLTGSTVVVAADAIDAGRPMGLGAAVSGGLSALKRLLALVVPLVLLFGAIGALVALMIVSRTGLGQFFVLGMLVALPVIAVLSVRLTPILPVIILEERGPLDAIERSWKLSRGRALAIFGTLVILSFATGPALWGASLLGIVPGPASVVALGIAGLLTAAISIIATTLIYRDLTALEAGSASAAADTTGGIDVAGPARDAGVPAAANAGRAVGLGLVLGVGTILFIVGVGTFGSRISEFPQLPVTDPGVMRAGHSFSLFNPCEPSDVDTTFTVGEEVYLGGYFTRAVADGEFVDVALYRDGNRVVAAAPFSSGVVESQCYFMVDPFVTQGAGTYRLDLIAQGEVIGSGTFTVER